MWLVSPCALAEPTPGIQYLMEEPVSMLEWGLHRLSSHLQASLGANSGTAETRYWWATNRIQIRLTLIDTPPSVEEARNVCAKTIDWVRGTLAVVDGQPQLSGVSAVPSFFSHHGFRGRNEPQALGPELDARTEIHVDFHFKEPHQVRCRGELLGTNYESYDG